MPGPFRQAWSHAPERVRAPAGIVRKTFQLYVEDGCGTFAAAIAYYAIFSLVPLSIVILSVLGMVVDRDRIVQFVFDQVPLQETPSVQESVETIVRRAQQISVAGATFGLIALIWGSSGIFAAVRRGLNAASHARQRRPYWRGKAVDFALIPLLGALILLSIGMTATAQFAIEEAGGIGPLEFATNPLLRVTSFVVPALLSFTLFLLLYRLVPTARPAWRDALAGAAFATVLFEVTKNVYALLIAEMPFTKDTAIYAGFGTALVFLFWMFINASILLLGAEFSRVLRESRTGAAARELATLAPAAKPRQARG